MTSDKFRNDRLSCCCMQCDVGRMETAAHIQPVSLEAAWWHNAVYWTADLCNRRRNINGRSVLGGANVVFVRAQQQQRLQWHLTMLCLCSRFERGMFDDILSPSCLSAVTHVSLGRHLQHICVWPQRGSDHLPGEPQLIATWPLTIKAEGWLSESEGRSLTWPNFIQRSA